MEVSDGSSVNRLLLIQRVKTIGLARSANKKIPFK
jgi:hypothetical protein